MRQTRLLIVDDHAIVRKGILMFLKTEPSVQIVGEAEDGADGIRMAQHLRPNVILMDLVMPGVDGIEAIYQLKKCLPDTKIIVLTTFSEHDKFNAALEAGADGYLLKDADGEALLQAIDAVQQGNMPLHPGVTHHLIKSMAKRNGGQSGGKLTDREKEVLQLVAKGWSNQKVAQALNLSPGTVKVHMSNILSKMNVASRLEAAMLAIKKGLISADDNS
jgi:DNA-binding NarL/FixJ family response regulator